MSQQPIGTRIVKALGLVLLIVLIVWWRFVWRPGSFPELHMFTAVPLIVVLALLLVRTLFPSDDPKPRIELPPLPRPRSVSRK